MKRFAAFILVAMMIACLAGCGSKEQAAEAAAENMLEQAGVGEDVNIEGDNVTIKGEDGEEYSFGTTQWPDSELAKAIPVFSNGTLSSVFESDDYVMVSLESVKAADFEPYLETVKAAYTNDAYEATYDGTYSFNATNADGISLYISYYEGTLTITVYSSQE